MSQAYGSGFRVWDYRFGILGCLGSIRFGVTVHLGVAVWGIGLRA